MLADLGIADAIGADNDGYPGILGYQGPVALRGHDGRVVPISRT